MLTESMTSVSGTSWPPPSTASGAGSNMTDGVICTPESVDRGTVGGGMGERIEDALWLISRAALRQARKSVISGKDYPGKRKKGKRAYVGKEYLTHEWLAVSSWPVSA